MYIYMRCAMYGFVMAGAAPLAKMVGPCVSLLGLLHTSSSTLLSMSLDALSTINLVLPDYL